jgi:hypothetical protein
MKRELSYKEMRVSSAENGREDPRYSLTYCLKFAVILSCILISPL